MGYSFFHQPFHGSEKTIYMIREMEKKKKKKKKKKIKKKKEKKKKKKKKKNYLYIIYIYIIFINKTYLMNYIALKISTNF